MYICGTFKFRAATGRPEIHNDILSQKIKCLCIKEMVFLIHEDNKNREKFFLWSLYVVQLIITH